MSPRLSLTRRVSFAAAHRYRRPDWSDEQNAATFGPCARPNYHGHGYTCDVTVTGPLDEATGFVADLGVLDRVLRDEVHARLDHANLNLDVPEFAEGRQIPTGENLARWICLRVQGALDAALGAGALAVTRVTVAEDQALSATYEA